MGPIVIERGSEKEQRAQGGAPDEQRSQGGRSGGEAAGGERRPEGRRRPAKRDAGAWRKPREVSPGPGRHRVGGDGVGSGRVRRTCEDDSGRRWERRRGGAHEHEGGTGSLTVRLVEAGEHRSGPATGAVAGAARLAVVAV